MVCKTRLISERRCYSNLSLHTRTHVFGRSRMRAHPWAQSHVRAFAKSGCLPTHAPTQHTRTRNPPPKKKKKKIDSGHAHRLTYECTKEGFLIPPTIRCDPCMFSNPPPPHPPTPDGSSSALPEGLHTKTRAYKKLALVFCRDNLLRFISPSSGTTCTHRHPHSLAHTHLHAHTQRYTHPPTYTPTHTRAIRMHVCNARTHTHHT